MRFIILFLVVVVSVSCGETNPNPTTTPLSEKNQPKDITPLCAKEFVDGAPLGEPPSFPDDMTKNALLKVKQSSKDLKLAIGVSNTNREVQRFKKECEDWMFLDIFGVLNGPEFFHVNLEDLESLTRLADTVGERFSLIAIDYSVTRLVSDFSFAHIFQIMRMLKKKGILHMWYDERPFMNSKETKNSAEYGAVIADIKHIIEILDRAVNSPNLNEGFFGPLQNFHSHNYGFFPELPAADAKVFNDLVKEHSDKKITVLKKLFLLKNMQFELKKNGFPLPVGEFDYTKLPFVTLTKL